MNGTDCGGNNSYTANLYRDSWLSTPHPAIKRAFGSVTKRWLEIGVAPGVGEIFTLSHFVI